MFIILQDNQSPEKAEAYRISASDLQKLLCFSVSLFEMLFIDSVKAKYGGT